MRGATCRLGELIITTGAPITVEGTSWLGGGGAPAVLLGGAEISGGRLGVFAVGSRAVERSAGRGGLPPLVPLPSLAGLAVSTCLRARARKVATESFLRAAALLLRGRGSGAAAGSWFDNCCLCNVAMSISSSAGFQMLPDPAGKYAGSCSVLYSWVDAGNGLPVG